VNPPAPASQRSSLRTRWTKRLVTFGLAGLALSLLPALSTSALAQPAGKGDKPAAKREPGKAKPAKAPAPAMKAAPAPKTGAAPALKKSDAPAPAPAGALELQLPVQRETFDNGLRVVLNVDHTSPTVAVAVVYDVGSRNEEPGRSGFAHLFEHMMFQGSKNVVEGRALSPDLGARGRAQRHDQQRPHQLLRGAALERARARPLARGRPDEVARREPRELREPAQGGAGGVPDARLQRGLRAERAAPGGAGLSGLLALRALHHRLDGRPRRRASSTGWWTFMRTTTGPTTPCW
jgi:hypothetical protein